MTFSFTQASLPNSAPPTSARHQGGTHGWGAHRQDTGCSEGSSVTPSAINLFLGVSFLTLRHRPTYFFHTEYSAVFKRNSQGDFQDSKSVSSFLLFYRRADTGPEKLRPLCQWKWGWSQGHLTLHPVLLLSRTGILGGAIVGCGRQLWLPRLCIQGGNAPVPSAGPICLRGCICRHIHCRSQIVWTYGRRGALRKGQRARRGAPRMPGPVIQTSKP